MTLPNRSLFDKCGVFLLACGVIHWVAASVIWVTKIDYLPITLAAGLTAYVFPNGVSLLFPSRSPWQAVACLLLLDCLFAYGLFRARAWPSRRRMTLIVTVFVLGPIVFLAAVSVNAWIFARWLQQNLAG